MPPRREQPTGHIWAADDSEPTTPYQALMEAPPGAEVRQSSLERGHEAPDLVREALSELTDDERDMVLMHFSGLSVRDIAANMGMAKTTVHNKLPGLLSRAMESVRNDPRLGEMFADEGAEEGDSQE